MPKVKVKTSEQRLAEMGRSVTRRLTQPGRCQIVAQNGITLYSVQNFLSVDECSELIAMIDGKRQPSELLAEHPDKDFRTSDSSHTDPRHPTIEKIDQRISALLGLDPRYGETMQGQVYEVGQQFKPHFDSFRKGAFYWEKMKEVGGQRSWTAMIYLNEPAAGGETEFPNAGLKVKPVTAMLVAWNNMSADGTPNEATLHAGVPVLAGTKYIVTKWFRERFWK
jgi:prolyl 4-hydroxylase